ncbi:unnamed protein product, partial [Symbiodinium sp. KB8]
MADSSAAYSESTPVLKDRLKRAGFEDAQVETIASSVKTLKNLAFISSYSPGQADDAPLKVLSSLLSQPDLSIALKSSWRAAFHEAYAVVTAELKQQVERSEEVQVRTLTQPERAERYEKQVKRLSGVNIKGSSEPSERLVDVCVAIYERNQLQYVPWSRCSSREQEAQNESRKEVKLALDGSGKVKVDSASKEVVADTSTEVLVMQALQRRALAMEQANIVPYTLLDLWHQRLMKARLTDPPPGYSRPSFDQLRLADQKLFSELQDETRSGIQALSSGRPVDNLIKDVMHRAEVSSLLLPLPAPSVASVAKSSATAPPPQPTWRGNGKGKGKSKGKPGVGPWLKPLKASRGEAVCDDALSGRVDALLALFEMLPPEDCPRSDDSGARAFGGGAYMKGGIVGLRANSRKHPNACKAFASAIRFAAPTYPFTSFSVHADAPTTTHVDRYNADVYNIILPLTRFEGGGIWLQDASGSVLSPEDDRTLGVVADVAAGPCAIDARPVRLAFFHKGARPRQAYVIGRVGASPVEVESANLIYLQMARFCEWLSSLNISWSVENPERSYMWLLPEWNHLRSQMTLLPSGIMPPVPVETRSYPSSRSEQNLTDVASECFRRAGIRPLKARDEAIRLRDASYDRQCAVKKWVTLIAVEPAAWEIAKQTYGKYELRFATGGIVESVSDALAGKANSTLHGRAGPLLRYAKFWGDVGKTCFPVDEAQLYDFLKSLEDCAPG